MPSTGEEIKGLFAVIGDVNCTAGFAELFGENFLIEDVVFYEEDVEVAVTALDSLSGCLVISSGVADCFGGL